jgi:Tfp pilus assembly ATPase PilU
MRRYADRPMAFADACLVRMAELHANASVWTLDADFRIYRKNRRQTLSLVIPGA